ncbi:MAPEG family protein [Nocardioides marmorisolisilvae]|uniref:MAPEG family protein n=1 Tax=Nocardioides marmorisolisilvae TaxID=1542737 RepID=A0A3N0DSD8_9ACTN|nr:MAPEG family protein [Nocardioides marmorisolisilvae]RNL78431.1 MAPEG family protein [Nocardioides marmorisolisilvae]
MSDTMIICIALMGALVFVLGANVTRHRAMRGKSGGPQMSTDPTDRLFIAQRAHGNATEYVPTLIGLLIVCSTLTSGTWLNVVAIVATAARYVHAFGMLSSKSLAEHGPVRDSGAMFTYLSGLALAVTAIASL